MKLHKWLVGGGLAGAVIVSSLQLFGVPIREGYHQMNTVYAMNKETTAQGEEEAYKEKCIEALKSYFGLDIDKLKDQMSFVMEVKDRQAEIKLNNIDIDMAKQAFESGQMTEAQYNEIVANIEKTNQKTFDKICCTIEITDNGLDGVGTYVFVFNSNTKEIYSIRGPLSDEATMMMVEGTKASIQLEPLKQTYQKLLEENKFGGIEKFNYVGTIDEDIPGFIYKDQKDDSKKVEVDIDPGTGKLYGIFVE